MVSQRLHDVRACDNTCLAAAMRAEPKGECVPVVSPTGECVR
jgi:hypothetical protein